MFRFLRRPDGVVAPALFGQVPTCNGRPATIVATTPGVINGTPGDDVIVGSPGDDKIFGFGGNDTICGGGGNDQITGGQGNDTVFGEAGNDTFFWFPGDGSDRVEGSTEIDTLVMAGAIVAENIGLSAVGGRLRLTRDVASVVLDVGSVELVSFGARGGSDTITVASLAGIGLQQVTLDLEGVADSKTPDGVADSIFVFGTTADDQITLTSSGTTMNIAGLGPAIQIRNADPTLDTLAVYGVEGSDHITAQGVTAGVMNLTLDGGPGSDTIRGSAGADTLVGDSGDDTFEWPLGTPADLVAGDGDTDTLLVIGTAGNDRVFFAAAPLEAQVQNLQDNVAFTAGVEQIVFQAKAGADQVTVSTLAASTVQKVTIDLRLSPPSTTTDLAVDAITVNCTNDADNVTITGGAGSATVTGLAPTVMIVGAESARDTLTVNGLAGNDVMSASALSADAIRLTMRGGQGFDTLTGSAGDDIFAWFPGDSNDTIEGGPGNDLLQISGRTLPRTLRSPRTGRDSDSRATWLPSFWTSTPSRVSASRRSEERTQSRLPT